MPPSLCTLVPLRCASTASLNRLRTRETNDYLYCPRIALVSFVNVGRSGWPPKPNTKYSTDAQRRSFIYSTKDRNHYTSLGKSSYERSRMENNMNILTGAARANVIYLSRSPPKIPSIYLEVQEELPKAQSIRHLVRGTVTT
jgi:hypothetical protein